MTNKLAKKIYNGIHKTLKIRNSYYLHEPTFSKIEEKNLYDCIKSTFVSTVGKDVSLFEANLKKYLNAKDIFLCNSGTSALHLSLICLGIQNNDEVIVPGFSFVASANAVSYTGAIPHFVDIENETLGIDPNKLNERLEKISLIKNGNCYNKFTKRRISAIIPVHIFGHPCKINEIIKISKKFKLKIIEDAAESIGSFYKNKHTGTFADLGVISFNGNKTITTGSGGAIIINKSKYSKIIKHIGSTAKLPHKWEYIHDKIGYNYRMAAINAAIGRAQLNKIEVLIKKKRSLFLRYKKNLQDINELNLVEEPIHSRSNYWLNTIILDENIKKKERDVILKLLNESKIYARPIWKPLYKLPMYNKNPKDNLHTCKQLEYRIINLPSSSHI